MVLAGWINRQQQEAINYFLGENRIVKERYLAETGRKRIILKIKGRISCVNGGVKVYHLAEQIDISDNVPFACAKQCAVKLARSDYAWIEEFNVI